MKWDLRSAYWSVLAATVLLAASGCVKTDNEAPDSPAEVKLTSIAVTPAATKVGIGAKLTYVATGTYSDASTKALTEEVVWSVDNTSFATISNEVGKQGELTGVATGTATVTATAAATDSTPAIVGTTTVEVVTATLSSIEIKIDSELGRTPVGFTTHLSAIGHYSDESEQDLTQSVTWMGLTPDIATVSDVVETKGYLTGIKAGTGRITATLDTLTQEARVVVSNETLTTITMTPATTSLRGGAMLQFSCKGNFTGGGYDNPERLNLTDQTAWASSDTSVVTVSNDVGSKGLATGVSGLFPSSANVTATYTAPAGSSSVVGTSTVTRPLF
ncbi:Ig-like domain-containing protein [Hydrocarboniphaga sp.]|uniref:Ig-like domain-containing protein n=1 Tax=Hydrocarboniphaga sp. TaxID=2033016 RepID=UPI003D0BDE02